MNQDTIHQAARLLWDHWQAGTAIEGLPPDCRPATRTEGYAIQAAFANHSAAGLTGWKIAATSTAGQQHIGVGGPLAGRLLAERTYASGTALRLAGNRMSVAEPEFAFRCGVPLPPRSHAYAIDEVSDAMDALIPAIEVPDSRFRDFASVGEAQLVADNACAHQFILGEPTSADWRTLDLAQHPVHATISGSLEREGKGANVLGNPLIALTWLVNELSGLGMTLERGVIVTTGTSLVPLDIAPGDHVIADFGSLGRIEAKFA